MSTSPLSITRPLFDVQGPESWSCEHFGLIYRYVYRKIGHRQDAEDLTSAILLKAVRMLNAEADPQQKYHWLLRVMRTTVIDYWRAQARARSRSLEVLQEMGWEGPEDRDPFGLYGKPVERVQQLLQRLSARERDVLVCRFIHELSIRETAVRLGLTEGNVKTIQYRALKRAASVDAGRV